MKISNTLLISLLFLALGVSLVSRESSAFTLNEYLTKVKADNLSYKGVSEQAGGAALKARQADLFFTPQLFAEIEMGHDGKESQPKTSDRINLENYSFGIAQQFKFGLQSKVYYKLSKTEFVSPNVMFISLPEYWDASPTVELSMPLWANGFGRSAVANQEIVFQKNKAEQFGSKARSLAYLAQAEATYWKLSAWKDVVRIQEKALLAAKNILSYVSRKEKMNLGNEGDVVQAKALIEARAFELQLAKNKEDEVLRSFNRYLNRSSDVSVESLESINYKSLENLEIPSGRPGDRYDVKAAEAQLVLAKASSRLIDEQNKPTLDIYGTYSLNGRDQNSGEAIANTGHANTDTSFIGIRFKMPLNLSANSDVKAGAIKSERAAEYQRQFAFYSQQQDWASFTRSLKDARNNLRLLRRIESAQKTKLMVERSRLQQGRTTTFRVLLFEQDYSQAAAAKVKAAAGILALQTQLNLYNFTNKGMN